MSKIEKTCLTCGKTFSVFPCNADRLFCSRECTDKGRSKGLVGTKKRKGEEITCIVCGKKVYKRPYDLKRGGGKVCSPKCNAIARSKGLIKWKPPHPPKTGEEIACVICGKKVYRKRSYIDRGINKTCGSKACLSAYGRLQLGLDPLKPENIGKERHQVDKTTVWLPSQKKAWLDTKCAICGSTENLQLDHIVPVFLGGKTERDNAQTLCAICHMKKSKEELEKAKEHASLGSYSEV